MKILPYSLSVFRSPNQPSRVGDGVSVDSCKEQTAGCSSEVLFRDKFERTVRLEALYIQALRDAIKC